MSKRNEQYTCTVTFTPYRTLSSDQTINRERGRRNKLRGKRSATTVTVDVSGENVVQPPYSSAEEWQTIQRALVFDPAIDGAYDELPESEKEPGFRHQIQATVPGWKPLTWGRVGGYYTADYDSYGQIRGGKKYGLNHDALESTRFEKLKNANMLWIQGHIEPSTREALNKKNETGATLSAVGGLGLFGAVFSAAMVGIIQGLSLASGLPLALIGAAAVAVLVVGIVFWRKATTTRKGLEAKVSTLPILKFTVLKNPPETRCFVTATTVDDPEAGEKETRFSTLSTIPE